VLHHHERFNGGGYPYGLRGAEIPIGARIVAVADAYHAMVNGRPYSNALAHHEALAELERHAGTQFDPRVVRAFTELYFSGVPDDGREEVNRIHDAALGDLHERYPAVKGLPPRPATLPEAAS
jgi:HD-GYP domain-containing protein (c-di-GMP phosphodiesterase class II)